MKMVSTSATGSEMDVHLTIKNYFEAIGLKVDLRVIDATQLQFDWRNRKTWGIAYASTKGVPVRLEVERGLNVYFWSKGTVAAYTSPELDNILVKIGQAKDYKEYDQLLRSFGDILYNEYALCPLYIQYKLAGVNPKTVKRYDQASAKGYDNMEYVEKP